MMRDHMMGFPPAAEESSYAEMIGSGEWIEWGYYNTHPFGFPVNRKPTPLQVQTDAITREYCAHMRKVAAFERGNWKLPDGTTVAMRQPGASLRDCLIAAMEQYSAVSCEGLQKLTESVERRIAEAEKALQADKEDRRGDLAQAMANKPPQPQGDLFAVGSASPLAQAKALGGYTVCSNDPVSITLAGYPVPTFAE